MKQVYYISDTNKIIISFNNFLSKDIISVLFFQTKEDLKVCKYLDEIFLFGIILTKFDIDYIEQYSVK
jgi:hypothetical protein